MQKSISCIRATARLIIAVALAFLFEPVARAEVDASNLGKGDWIWRMSEAQRSIGVSDAQGVVNHLKSRGLQWVTVKCGDGNTIWTQFNQDLVDRCHAAGLKIFAWAYAYGGAPNPYNPSDVPGEINVALNALAMGIDGFIINAESEYESLGITASSEAARQYCEGIRAHYPNTFLAHAPFAGFNTTRRVLYRTFGQYCDAVMPQAYYYFNNNLTPEQMVDWMNASWAGAHNEWIQQGYAGSVRPIAPIGWGAAPATGAHAVRFADALRNHPSPASPGGYKGFSFWSFQSHTADMWNGIGMATLGNYPSVPYIITHPASRTVRQGEDVTFGVTASTPLVNYQWRLNGTSLPGATNATLLISDAQQTNAGNYSVIILNDVGFATSRHASLRVQSELYPLLFVDDFETNSSSRWKLFWGADNNIADYTVNWAFDYSTNRYTHSGMAHMIPPAPYSTGNATRGVKFTVNNNDGIEANAGVNIYGKDLVFTGDVALKFDMWINYPGGSAGAGATGQTEVAIFGINHLGTQPNWHAASATSTDGIWFGITGEGGSVRDFRAYIGNPSGKQIEPAETQTGIFEPNSTGPLNQALFPPSQFETGGVPGKSWAEVELAQTNGVITWKINGALVARRTNTSPFTYGTIMLGYMDFFPSIANPAADAFVIFDNVRVEDRNALPIVAPSLLSQPSSHSVKRGTNITLEVSANGTPPLSYEWRRNGSPLENGTTSTLSIPDVQAGDAGSYSVVVRNAAGSVASRPALLNVVPPAAARFDSVQRLEDGRISMRIFGDTGERYAIETSTNLTHWSVATELLLDGETAGWIHTPESAPRFFRAVLLDP